MAKNDLTFVSSLFQHIGNIDEKNFSLSSSMWQYKSFKKGEFYNNYQSVCKYVGFVLDGLFRTYYIDISSGDEKNIFFFTKHTLVVAFKSFVTQSPCNYHTQAIADSNVLMIHINDLQTLYKQSHQWEHLGRIIAEIAYTSAMDRTEGFLFKTPEERYVELMKQHPEIIEQVPLYHLSSYLGIQGPSLSRIRKRLSQK
ncbi:MAG: Crp/Fnr family transcriptional regulator [Bacteroidota bacterium]